MTDPPYMVLKVDESIGTDRLDKYVASRLPDISRRTVMDMIRHGVITLNGKKAAKAHAVRPGDRIEIQSPPRTRIWAPLADASIPLHLHHVDNDVAVVEKPSGIPSIPLTPDERGTLANAVVHRFPECGHLCRRSGDGGLLQRLDKETSGAVVVARSASAFGALLDAQQHGEIEKGYLALVRTEAEVPPVVALPLKAAGVRGGSVFPDKRGQDAVTRLTVKHRKGPWTLLEAVIHRGVRHQIRAHLAGIGMPIVGDKQYNTTSSALGLNRLFLHAYRVSFHHPATEEMISILAPLPKELSQFVEKNLIISF